MVSNDISVEVKCPTIISTNLATHRVFIDAATSPTKIYQQTDFANVGSDAPACQITLFTLMQIVDGAEQANPSTWVDVTTSGDIMLDTSTLGTRKMVVKYTHLGTVHTS